MKDFQHLKKSSLQVHVPYLQIWRQKAQIQSWPDIRLCIVFAHNCEYSYHLRQKSNCFPYGVLLPDLAAVYMIYILYSLSRVYKMLSLKYTWLQGFQIRDSGPLSYHNNDKRIAHWGEMCFLRGISPRESYRHETLDLEKPLEIIANLSHYTKEITEMCPSWGHEVLSQLWFWKVLASEGLGRSSLPIHFVPICLHYCFP